ncbi:DNA-directed RNA polymerase subunit alpha C-terminal domain-containing protein [Pseudoalteromonas prydzensis]|uniref:DNA-directed RNA polymerase subunit alpha C-terminal domain-containing protein n=1 Tax=Pseudoalteromonas prydzensis TaxID=182141 RepID=UPI0024BCF9E5|nr:DNA-directed RNA polymerase subunit alpha C-terminal domain-containing protein [Pseudoalteromonas prydzensis]
MTGYEIITSDSIPLSKPIENFGFSNRVINKLKENNIITLQDILANSDIDLLKLPGLGKQCLKEINKVKSCYNYEIKEHRKKQELYGFIIPSETMSIPLDSLSFSMEFKKYLEKEGYNVIEDLLTIEGELTTWDESGDVDDCAMLTPCEIDEVIIDALRSYFFCSLENLKSWDDIQNKFSYHLSLEGISTLFPDLHSFLSIDRLEFISIIIEDATKPNSTDILDEVYWLKVDTGIPLFLATIAVEKGLSREVELQISLNDLNSMSDIDFLKFCGDIQKYEYKKYIKKIYVNLPDSIFYVIKNCKSFLEPRDIYEKFELKNLEDTIIALKAIDSVWEEYCSILENYYELYNETKAMEYNHEFYPDPRLKSLFDINQIGDGLSLLDEYSITREVRSMLNEYSILREKHNFDLLMTCLKSLRVLPINKTLAKYEEIYEIWPKFINLIKRYEIVETQKLYKELNINGNAWMSIVKLAMRQKLFTRKNGFFSIKLY